MCREKIGSSTFTIARTTHTATRPGWTGTSAPLAAWATAARASTCLSPGNIFSHPNAAVCSCIWILCSEEHKKIGTSRTISFESAPIFRLRFHRVISPRVVGQRRYGLPVRIDQALPSDHLASAVLNWPAVVSVREKSFLEPLYTN